MNDEKWMIQPFNKTYICCAGLFVCFCFGMCGLFDFLGSAVSGTFVLWFSGFMTIFLLVYKVRLWFDKEYERIYYPGEKLNIWNELIFYPCNVIMILSFLGLLLENRLLISFGFYYSICPIAALCFPPGGFDHYSILTPRVFCFYFYHYMIMALAIFMVKTGIYFPEYADVLPAVLLYALLSFLSFLLNLWMRKSKVNARANYFYNMDPDGNAVMDALWKVIPFPYLFTVPLMLAGAAAFFAETGFLHLFL